MMVAPPQFATMWAEVKYLAYVNSRNEVDVTYCMLLSLILNSNPPSQTKKKDSFVSKHDPPPL